MRTSWVVAVLVAAVSVARGATIHVASGGRDEGDGSEAKPFATLQRARDAVRGLKAHDGVRIVLHAGTYVLKEPLEIGAQDSGTQQPVVWEAVGEDVRIVGGPAFPADGFVKVTDEKVLARLRTETRAKVVQLDLGHVGDVELGEYPDAFRGVPAAPELLFNDQRMTVARWPNKGWATIAAIVEAGSEPRYGDKRGRGGVFQYSGDEPYRR